MTARLIRMRATAAGLDPAGGPWVVICNEHSSVVNVETRAAARTISHEDFCEGHADTEPVSA